MLSERQLENLLKVFERRMQAVTDDYIRRMGEHIRDIGNLTQTDVHRLTQMKRVNANIEAIKREIAEVADASAKDIEAVFRAAAESDEKFAEAVFAEDHAPTVKTAPIQTLSSPLERIIKAQLRVTVQEMANLSQTTLVSDAYRKAVDVAVQTVQIGVTDYASAIRSALKEAAKEGLRVQYPSGLTRRVDTAVRQNVLDGVRALNQDVLRQLGKEYGADGVEISAHALCALDHLPYQGLQFSNKEFDRLQNLLRRPFGLWNCKHTVFPILLGVSEPTHTREQLEQYRANSTEEVTIDGVTKSRYEWTQAQRRIETAVREQKLIANAAKAAGDPVARRQAQAAINRLDEEYAKISDAAGLYQKWERMAVAGFRKVKSPDELPTTSEHGIIGNTRRIVVDGESVRPISRSRLRKIMKAFERSGGSIQMSERIDRYLDSKGVQGITYSHDVIFLHSNPSRATVFEELIHSAQYRNGRIDHTELSQVKAEIEAKEKLIRYSKAYKLTDAEIRETRKLLKRDIEDYERMVRKDE